MRLPALLTKPSVPPMEHAPARAASFERVGPAEPASPVVVSVPHAGRDYPAAMIPMLRVAPSKLLPLEDRFIDLAAEGVTNAGATLLTARRARAWIDLNRAEEELDAAMVEGAATGLSDTPKVRGGLGLVPRRLPGVGELWRGRLKAADVAQRIAEDHRPYHAALAEALAAARARFGIALLIDLHSMPPVKGSAWRVPPRIVLGDRFGRTAAPRFTARLAALAQAAGLPVAENSPYSGGHILERHGDPARGIHAIQVEVDRSLYLAPGLREPSPKAVVGVARLVEAMTAALADEALGGSLPIAAE